MAAAGGSWKGGSFMAATGGIGAGSVIKVGNASYTLTASDARQINAALEQVRAGDIARSEVSAFAGGAARAYRQAVDRGQSGEGLLQRAAAYRAIADAIGVTPRAPRTRSRQERDQAEYEARSRPRTRTEYMLEGARR